MTIIRPARLSDVPALLALAKKAGRGMTTMPHNETEMKKRIMTSQTAFARGKKNPPTEIYFMVLEEDGVPVGTTGIFTNLGAERPFYSYRLSHITNQAPDLDMRTEIDLLSLVNDYHGYAEIGTLFLDEAYRGGGRGRLLSFSRFMLMGAHQDRFGENVMAEIRGWSDTNEHFPFWEAIGQKFFDMDFVQADARSAHDHRFIADLMPKYPIYVSLLNDEARRIIGEPHDLSRAAMELLKSQGFRYRNYVDIFDGGPSIETPIKNIETIRNTRKVGVEIGTPLSDGEKSLIANTNLKHYAVMQGFLKPGADNVMLSTEQAEALNVEAGDTLAVSPLKGRSS